MEKRLTMLLASLFLFVGMAMAQSQVSGTVVSAEDGQPIIGAAIKVAGTNTGTVTDVDGKFSISVPAGSTLTVTYIGMQTKNVKAKPGMTISLESDAKQLDEVMVVAFGTEKRSQFTGSASVIDSKQIEKVQVTSVTNALAGAVTGVQLTSANGAPDASSTIRVRGFNSINAGLDPLIIVDGAPYEGSMANLNPADVASMTVLKDASAAALYGARGANGVILITTKQAKTGNATITFDAKIGWNSRALQHYDVVKSPAKYYEMQYDALKNYFVDKGQDATTAWKSANAAITGNTADGGLGTQIWTIPEGEMLVGLNGRMNPHATLGYIANYKGEDYLITPDDWEDVGTRTGQRQEYNLSISGADTKSHFFASLGYLDNQGITYKSDFKRITGRLKADYQAKKWLKVGANISFAHRNGNSLDNNGSSTSTGNLWAFTTQMAPIYPAIIRNADGTQKYDSNGIGMMDYGDGTNGGQIRPFIYNANPLLDTKLNTINTEGNQSNGNAFAEITFIPGLKLNVNGTYTLLENRYTWVYNPYYGQFDSTGGTVSKEHTRWWSYNLQQILNYTHAFGKHNATFMIGHEYSDERSYDLYATKNMMFSQKNKELNGAVVDGQSSGSSKGEYNNEGYFGRALYDYDGKYFGEFSYRHDASSRFNKKHRWGDFWSIGGSWIISKEPWFNASWVDELRFKASVGQMGNDVIGSYRYTDLYDITNSGGQIGTSFASKGTEDITWETNTNANFGLDFSLFNHKLTGTFEYYTKKTTDMLFAFYVAPSLGYSSYYDNIGDLTNKGVELELNYNAIHTRNIDWNIHFNITSWKNNITKLDADKKTTVVYTPDGEPVYGYANGNRFIAEDQAIYTFYLKDYAGVDPNTGKSLWWKNVYETDEKGKPIYYDMNNKVVGSDYDGVKHQKVTKREKTDVYADADYYDMKGKTSVPRFTGGFGTSFTCYGFDLSVNFSYQLGGKQYDGTYATFMSSPTSANAGFNFHKDLLKAWTAENPSTSIPRFQWDDLYNGSSSTRFMTSSSYLNIENINAGYTFPASWTRKALIEQLRLYVSMENVAYISKRKGFDPRQGYTGSTNATYYAPMRTISVGATVTF